MNSGCDVILEGGDKCFDRQGVQDALGTLWKDSVDSWMSQCRHLEDRNLADEDGSERAVSSRVKWKVSM